VIGQSVKETLQVVARRGDGDSGDEGWESGGEGD